MNSSISRTKNYTKQLKLSFLFKFFAVICSFLVIPLLIDYLGNESYGVWSTLLSIMSWMVLFDVGIGNGLRNKISESIAKGDLNAARGYISTAYIIIGLIAILLIFTLHILCFFLPMQKIFNTTILTNNELQLVVRITGTFIIINFWLGIINQIFNGLQKTSIVVAGQFLSQFLSLLFVFLLIKITKRSLEYLSFFYGFSLILTNILFSFLFFRKRYDLSPKYSFFTKNYVQSIATLGLKFFIIQIAVIILFTTNKIMITQLFGPKYVTEYDIVFKLYSIITIGHTMLMAPLWPAYGDAFHKNDYSWIMVTLRKQIKIYFIILVGIIVLSLFSEDIIHIWIGEDFFISKKLITAMGVFTAISTWNNIFSYFINSTNKLNIQMYTSLVGIVLNIPLTIFLVKLCHLGIEGVVYATAVSLSLFAIFGPLQSKQLLLNIKERHDNVPANGQHTHSNIQ